MLDLHIPSYDFRLLTTMHIIILSIVQADFIASRIYASESSKPFAHLFRPDMHIDTQPCSIYSFIIRKHIPIVLLAGSAQGGLTLKWPPLNQEK
jgi:hypothetical protein